MTRRAVGKAIQLYGLVNIGFLLLVVALSTISQRSGHDPIVYLVVLCAICTVPLLVARETNGEYCILVLSGPMFFVYYGLADLLGYIVEDNVSKFGTSSDLFTYGEIAIVSGLCCFAMGFVASVRLLRRAKSKVLAADWNASSIVVMGLLSLGVGTWALWTQRMITDEVWASGGVHPVLALGVVAGKMLEPIGTVMLSYAYLSTQKRWMLLILVTVFIAKIPMGLILDSKEIAISSLIIFIIVSWLYRSTVPLQWVAVLGAVIVLTFPIFYAFRSAIFHDRSVARTEVWKDIKSYMDIAIKESAGERGGAVSKGIKAFSSRVDFKTLTEIIVSRAGRDVKHQEGYTLSPLIYIFVPRILYPEKPQVPVGLIFNREFGVSPNPMTWISTTFLGELYWNFGWGGALGGMILIGASLGIISTLCNIRDVKSVTRLLILVAAIYFLVVRYETSIGQQYALFIRSLVGLILLHYVFRSRHKSSDNERESASRTPPCPLGISSG